MAFDLRRQSLGVARWRRSPVRVGSQTGWPSNPELTDASFEQPPRTCDQTGEAAGQILTAGVQAVLASRGEPGCSLVTSGQRADYPAFPAAAVDTTGCGDACSAVAFAPQAGSGSTATQSISTLKPARVTPTVVRLGSGSGKTVA
jgi:bifunctional ADP-heptose synthase (sugar kinase/adenylyltransferase)